MLSRTLQRYLLWGARSHIAFYGVRKRVETGGKGSLVRRGFTMSCPFCDMPSERVIRKNKYFYLVKDGFPVTKHHTLVISHDHEVVLDTMDEEQTLEFTNIIKDIKKQVLELDSTVTGFNIGINEGIDAGQTIMHFHCHVIPRRSGDAHNPRGGVRGVIPAKQGY